MTWTPKNPHVVQNGFVCETLDSTSARQYVWIREPADSIRNGKAIFVIDDELPSFHLPEPRWVLPVGGAVPPHKRGLVPVFKVASSWPATKLIAYLPLGDRQDVARQLIPTIQELISCHRADIDSIFVLVDSYVGSQEEGDAIGNVVMKQLAECQQSNAEWLSGLSLKVNYLSVSPTGNALDGTRGFVKGEVQARFESGSTLPDEVLSWFALRVHDPDDVTDISAATWRTLRTISLEWPLSRKKGEWWAHHWGYGGQYDPMKATAQELSDFRQALEEAIDRKLPKSELAWPNPNDESVGRRPWCYPSLRAMTQTVGHGRDLMICILLAGSAVEDELAEIRIDAHPTFRLIFDLVISLPFKHDYLWFNAPAVLDGLHQLALRFVEEVKDLLSPTRRRTKKTLARCHKPHSARLSWFFREQDSQNSKGLRIEVGQNIFGLQDIPGERAFRDPQLGWLPLDLPLEPTGGLVEPYRLIRLGGGALENADGRLLIEIPAQATQIRSDLPTKLENLDDFWVVANG